MKNESLPKIIAELLSLRGITTEEEIQSFLYPKLADLPHPKNLLNVTAAAELIGYYIRNKLQIVIWGDYDVDGTTSTALLVLFFRKIGIEVLWHIPNRLTDGYGLNVEWFRQNCSKFSSKQFLLITVDNGISSKDEVSKIKTMGGDVIVTDHHSIPQKGMPDCIVINPEQQECGFHKEKLAGVGLAFYLAVAVRRYLAKEAEEINLKQFLAFVALGTVADMVNLTPTNRILVRAGMEELKNSQFIGLTALLEVSGVSGDIGSEDIGFLLGPRLNAAGRLGNSTLVVELLTSENREIAKTKAQELDFLNLERKRRTQQDTEKTLTQTSTYQVEQEKVCVVHGEFHVGVAGIVASNLVEKFGTPAIVLARKNDKKYTGSGRSIEDINLIQAIEQCAELLERFGGHAMAAGVSLTEDKIDQFREKLGTIIRNQQEQKTKKPSAIHRQYDINCKISKAMHKDALRFFSLLEPFGPGNPQPIFYDDDSIVIKIKQVGKRKEHASLLFRGQYANYKGIGFGFGKYIDEIQEQPQRKIKYSLTKNRYRGTLSWQVRVHSI